MDDKDTRSPTQKYGFPDEAMKQQEEQLSEKKVQSTPFPDYGLPKKKRPDKE